MHSVGGLRFHVRVPDGDHRFLGQSQGLRGSELPVDCGLY